RLPTPYRRRRPGFKESISGTRAGGNALRGGSVDHGDPEVRMDMDLAGEADVGCDLSFAGQAGLLDIGLRPGVAAQDLDPARRAAGITAASMHDVDSRVFDGQNQLLARLDLERFLTINGHGRHDLGTPLGCVEQRAGGQLARAAGPVIGLGRCSNFGNSAATESLAFKICRGGWRCKASSTIARGAFALRRGRQGRSSRVASTSSSDVPRETARLGFLICFPLPTPIGYDIRHPVLERGVSLLDMLLLTRTGSHR